jgi:hypothetical protein
VLGPLVPASSNLQPRLHSLLVAVPYSASGQRARPGKQRVESPSTQLTSRVAGERPLPGGTANIQLLTDALSPSFAPPLYRIVTGHVPASGYGSSLVFSSDHFREQPISKVRPHQNIMDDWLDWFQCTNVGAQYKNRSATLYLGLGPLETAPGIIYPTGLLPEQPRTTRQARSLPRGRTPAASLDLVRSSWSASLKIYEGSTLCGHGRSSIPLRMACTKTRPLQPSEPPYGPFHQGVRSQR